MFVQLHGMSTPPKYEGKSLKRMRFFPNFLMRDLTGWILAIGILAALAALFPWELGEKADPFAPAPAGIRPEWYFIFMFQTLKYLPAKILFLDGEVVGILVFVIGALVWLFIPFLDRSSGQRKRRPVFAIAGVVVVLYIVVMTVVGYLS
jgi:quinol-cytochrome oxidoreductase complex cytochrome b subunit